MNNDNIRSIVRKMLAWAEGPSAFYGAVAASTRILAGRAVQFAFLHNMCCHPQMRHDKRAHFPKLRPFAQNLPNKRNQSLVFLLGDRNLKQTIRAFSVPLEICMDTRIWFFTNVCNIGGGGDVNDV